MNLSSTPTDHRVSSAAKIHDEDGRGELRDFLIEALNAVHTDQPIDEIEAVLNDVIRAFQAVQAIESPAADTELFPLQGRV